MIPTAGSLKASDVLLTLAYNEQMYELSWYQLLLGCLSRKWEQAVASHTTATHEMKDRWSTQFILHLWTYIKTIWITRNNILHGATAAETADRIFSQMREQVQDLYDSFASDPTILLPQHHYLFTTKRLAKRLKQNFDTAQCWLRSVTEARLMLDYHTQQQRDYAGEFFDDNDTDSYAPSTSISDTSTTLTISTQSNTTWTSQDNIQTDNNSIQDSQSDSQSLPDGSIMTSISMLQTYTSTSTSHSSSSPPSVISWSTDTTCN
jgi:hypothetical protein